MIGWFVGPPGPVDVIRLLAVGVAVVSPVVVVLGALVALSGLGAALVSRGLAVVVFVGVAPAQLAVTRHPRRAVGFVVSVRVPLAGLGTVVSGTAVTAVAA